MLKKLRRIVNVDFEEIEKNLFSIMDMLIYGLDLYNVDTALSVRYELKSKKK
jgi:hypothetical protein